MEIWRLNGVSNSLCIVFFALIFASVTFTTVSEDSNPYTPLIPCRLLPEEFVVCDPPVFAGDDNTDNTTSHQCPAKDSVSYEYSSVLHVPVQCFVVDDTIDCAGDRNFTKQGVPCIRYTTHCFVTVLLQSVFLGCFGVDRFVLGHVGAGVGKVVTLGGFGVWWLVDIVLLLTGNLAPTDNSNWCIYY